MFYLTLFEPSCADISNVKVIMHDYTADSNSHLF